MGNKSILSAATEHLHLEEDNGVVTLTISRPKQLNSLNYEIMGDLENLFIQLEADQTVRGVIITGEGRGFVAGADINEIYADRENTNRNVGIRFQDYLTKVHRTYNCIANLSKPVIAAVNGFALGGGCELALCCDIIIASTKAKFGLPEAKLGIIPTYMGTQRLPRAIGTLKAKELMYTSRFMDGQEAAACGLANQCVEPEELLPAARAMMDTILQRAPLSIRYMKLAVNNGSEMPLAEACEYERALGGLCLATDDCKEGVDAFVEKRDPHFQNK